MKKVTAGLLLIALFTACKEKSQVCFSDIDRKSFLELWESKTKEDIKERNNHKLIDLLSAEKESDVSIFNRSGFMDSMFEKNETKSLCCDSLKIIEANISGERYQRLKYLLCSIGSKLKIIKVRLNRGKWEIVKTTERDGKQILHAIKNLKSQSQYRNDRINDVFAVTQINSINKVKVEVFGGLDQAQFQILSLIDK